MQTFARTAVITLTSKQNHRNSGVGQGVCSVHRHGGPFSMTHMKVNTSCCAGGKCSAAKAQTAKCKKAFLFVCFLILHNKWLFLVEYVDPAYLFRVHVEFLLAICKLFVFLYCFAEKSTIMRKMSVVDKSLTLVLFHFLCTHARCKTTAQDCMCSLLEGHLNVGCLFFHSLSR